VLVVPGSAGQVTGRSHRLRPGSRNRLYAIKAILLESSAGS